MSSSRWATAVVGVVIVVVYAVGSGIWVTSNEAWYNALDRPPWQPPDAVFGIVWPYNFLALVLATIVVAREAGNRPRAVWLIGLAVSVATALAWARLFYVDHALWPAAFALVATVVVTMPIVVVAWRTRWWAGATLVPYLVWLALAASLSVGYALRN